MLSLAERYAYDGYVEGETKGRAEGIAITTSRLAELIESGLSAEESIRRLNEELQQYSKD